jgi:hypothetical protein
VALTFGEGLASWCAIASHGSCDSGAQYVAALLLNRAYSVEMLYLIQVKNEKLDTLNFIEGVCNTSPHVLISEHGN